TPGGGTNRDAAVVPDGAPPTDGSADGSKDAPVDSPTDAPYDAAGDQAYCTVGSPPALHCRSNGGADVACGFSSRTCCGTPPSATCDPTSACTGPQRCCTGNDCPSGMQCTPSAVTMGPAG